MTKTKKILAGTLAAAALAAVAAGVSASRCAGFAGTETASRSAETPAAPAGTEFPVRLGGKTLSLRLALTELERRRGLTGCRGLLENAGMLFAYPDAKRRAFWMRGVPADLSIGFFDAAGTLLETREMQAENAASVFSRSDRVKFALEMRARWFEENGVVPGARLSPDDVAAAVEARGFPPEKFAPDAPAE